MTSEQQSVKEWMTQFGQATPEKPIIPDLATRILRGKLILEEALETLAALGLQIEFINSTGRELGFVPELDKEFKLFEWSNGNLKDIADGCEDLKVVTEGTLVACGLIHKTFSVYRDHLGNVTDNRPIEYGTDPLFNEVMRSNFSKLWTREELEQDWPEMKGMEDITGSWHNLSGIDSRYVTKINSDANPRCYLVKDKDGKVIKSPSYSPANLQPIIDEMSK